MLEFRLEGEEVRVYRNGVEYIGKIVKGEDGHRMWSQSFLIDRISVIELREIIRESERV